MAVWNISLVNWRSGALLLFLVLLIGACGGNGAPESTSTRAAAPTTAVPPSETAASTATSPPPATADQASSGGGDSLGLDEALEQVIELYNEMLVLLSVVTDETSAVAAVDGLSRISKQVEDLEEQMGEYSEAEVTGAALFGRFQSFRQAIASEFNRISADPTALELVSEALENAN